MKNVIFNKFKCHNTIIADRSSLCTVQQVKEYYASVGHAQSCQTDADCCTIPAQPKTDWGWPAMSAIKRGCCISINSNAPWCQPKSMLNKENCF